MLFMLWVQGDRVVAGVKLGFDGFDGLRKGGVWCRCSRFHGSWFLGGAGATRHQRSESHDHNCAFLQSFLLTRLLCEPILLARPTNSRSRF